MRRRAILAMLAAMPEAGPAVYAQSGMRDRFFTRYPFDKWKEEGPVAHIRWGVKVGPVLLSPHQRLLVGIEIELDARETAARRGRELVAFFELTDSAGRRFRMHNTSGLADGKPRIWLQGLFALPGEYQLCLAVCDTQTSEHSFARRVLKVPPLRNDPLPEAWLELPPVEFIRPQAPPDGWFQPFLRGRVRLQFAPPRPVKIDIVMNLTPSERAAGSVHVFRHNMSILVPALKVLLGLEPRDGAIDLTLLDLTRQQSWQHKGAQALDWEKIRAPFAEANPGVIDVQSLAARGEMSLFFRNWIIDLLRTRREGYPVHAVIVLSAPVFLGNQEKAPANDFVPEADQRLFYLRYRPLAPRRFPVSEGLVEPVATAMPADDLERILKSLKGRLHGALTPEEFRKALASIITEIPRV